MMNRIISEDEVAKQFNNLSVSARKALFKLAQEYKDRGTFAFRLSDVADSEDAARPVLDYLVDRDFMIKSGSAEDPLYRLTRSMMDSLIHDGILELDEVDPKF